MKAVLFQIHDDSWLHRWAEDFPKLGRPVTVSLDALALEIEDAEILLLTNRAASEDAGALLRAKAKSLRWIHFLTAGFDRGVAMGLPENVRVSYSAGVRAPRVAEHAMALLLALTRALTLMHRSGHSSTRRH
jgi:phosphoglycerate dehydrogenase-like enzyme